MQVLTMPLARHRSSVVSWIPTSWQERLRDIKRIQSRVHRTDPGAATDLVHATHWLSRHPVTAPFLRDLPCSAARHM